MNNKLKVLLAWRASNDELQFFRSKLKDVAEIYYLKTGEKHEILKFKSTIEYIIGGWIPGEIIEKMEKIKVIQFLGVGVDRFDLDVLKRKNIILLAAKYSNSPAVAEHAFALMLSLAKKIIELDSSLKKGIWRPYAQEHFLKELYGKNLVILGFGGVGIEIAKRAKAFGMNIYAIKRTYDPSLKQKYSLNFLGTLKDLDYVLKVADFLVVAVPLTKETKNLIGERELKLMKPTAYVINVARGAIINEQALYNALTQGWIAGAGIDVWYEYPPSPYAPSKLGLHKLPNVIATPHKAGWTRESRLRAFNIAVDNVRNFVKGRQLRGLVDLDRGY